MLLPLEALQIFLLTKSRGGVKFTGFARRERCVHLADLPGAQVGCCSDAPDFPVYAAARTTRRVAMRPIVEGLAPRR